MRKGAVIAIIIIAVCVIGGVVGFIVYNNMNSPDTGSTTGSTQKSGSGLGFEDDQSDLVRKSKEGIVIPGWKQIAIDANTTEVYVDFYNPEENEGKYYMTFELKLADTGETLYTSKLVKPGDYIRQITLSRPLSPGTYNAVLHVQPYTADDAMTQTNNLDVELKLVAS